MDFVKQEVYNLDGNTQLEFLNRKKTIVIDKDRFLLCKQLSLENAGDEQFATLLNIPLEKVRYFKTKMQQFEGSMRNRRKAKKLLKQEKQDKRRESKKENPTRKRQVSSEERFRQARDLIARNLSTAQISQILKVSERSISRFKLRIRAEKQRLKAEGKLVMDVDDPDDENNFKNLSKDKKVKIIKTMFKKRLRIPEIADMLKISQRSVRRYKEKLDNTNDEEILDDKAEDWETGEDEEDVDDKNVVRKRSTRLSKRPAMIEEQVEDENDIEKNDEDEDEDESKDDKAGPAKRWKRTLYDKEKIDYASQLIDNRVSNKEMALLLEMSIASLRKLKRKIIEGTADELIDRTEEHYTQLNNTNADTDADPLHLLEVCYPSVAPTTSAQRFVAAKKKKTILTDRTLQMCRLLRENNVRTMDIAKLMQISERSVTRLLYGKKDVKNVEYEDDVVEEVEKLLADKDKILNPDISAVVNVPVEKPPTRQPDDAKRKLGTNLLAMKVKIKDIANMLDVSEKTVQRWKARMVKEQYEHDEELEDTEGEDENEVDDDQLTSTIDETIDMKVELGDEQIVMYEEL